MPETVCKHCEGWECSSCSPTFTKGQVDAAVKAETERCAKIVEFADLFWHLTPSDPRTRIAAAIRAPVKP